MCTSGAVWGNFFFVSTASQYFLKECYISLSTMLLFSLKLCWCSLLFLLRAQRNEAPCFLVTCFTVFHAEALSEFLVSSYSVLRLLNILCLNKRF